MNPLVIRARIESSVAMPWSPITLDSLLMAAVALRENLPPLGFGERADIQIPLARSACDRVYLASSALFEREAHERRFITKRFPIAEAQSLGAPSLRRILTSGGLSKGYRFPLETFHVAGDLLTWFAVGDQAGVEELLSCIHYLGKKRSCGRGKVTRWEVEPCEPWDGFPLLREGRPLRHLPLDWPGLGEHRVEMRVLAPPYWERWREEPCAC